MTAIHRRWSEARTLTEVGHAMADWLDDRLPGPRPAYGETRPDRETRHLRHTLAALCRGGYVTTNSQPGVTSRDLKQAAAVHGFATPTAARRLEQAARRHGLELIEGTWRVVTVHRGQPATAFGEPTRPIDLDAQWRAHLHPDAYRELAGAREIAVVAPEWGPAGDRMWPILAGAVR